MPDRPIEELREKVGESRTTVVDFSVERGKVEEFARAVYDRNPAHRDAAAARELGFDAVPAPLTFTRTSYFQRYRPPGVDVHLGFDLGLDQDHLVHGEQSYEFVRPVTVGDTLSGETFLEDVYQREGGRGGTLTFVVLRTEYRDEDDDLVQAETNVRIETEGAIDDGDDGTATPPTPTDRTRERRRSGRTASGYDDWDPPTLDELSVGDEGPTVEVGPVDREDFVRYAGASGDFNPVHYDEPYATSAGNPSVFGQGMFTAGVGAGMVSNWLGLANVTEFETRFTRRLWPGETLTASGEVRETAVEDGTTTVTVEFAVTTGDDDPVLEGTATADDGGG